MSDVVNSLDMIVEERGQNFSVGQRQLFCIGKNVCYYHIFHDCLVSHQSYT